MIIDGASSQPAGRRNLRDSQLKKVTSIGTVLALREKRPGIGLHCLISFLQGNGNGAN
jgi:hypothetical protein